MSYYREGLFAKVASYLEERPRVFLKNISAELRVERHTIERVVRELTGLSFRDYQKRVLLAQATKLLCQNPNRSIKEIAFTLGYKHPRDFSRFIKSETGKTPVELRKLYSDFRLPYWRL